MQNERIITFPRREWDDIKIRLNDSKVVYTVRVDDEYGKYKQGDVLKTEWDSEVKILSVKKIKGGINELKNEWDFFNELTGEMIQELSGYDDMEIISLVAKTKG